MTTDRLRDRAWLHDAYVVQGRTRASIAEELGCSVGLVGRAIRRHNLQRARPSATPLLHDRAWLREAYVVQGRSRDDVAAEVGCSPATLSRTLSRMGLARRSPTDSRLDDPAWLRQAHVTEGRTMTDIAAELDVTVTTVSSALARHGLRRPPEVRDPRLDDRAWLRDAYLTQDRSAEDIGAELGCHRVTVSQALTRFGIKTKAKPVRFPELHDPDWLAKARAAGMSRSEMAAAIGCSVAAVGKALRAHPAEKGPRYPQLADRAWLHEAYWVRLRTQAEIATEIGCPRESVGQALRDLGIPTRSGGPARSALLDDADWLRTMHVDRRMTQAQIADLLGVHRATVMRAVDRLGVPARPAEPTFPELADAGWLSDHYEVKGWTAEQIAEHVGCDPSTVRRAIRSLLR